MTSTAEKRQMKSAARLYAVQALFQMEVSGQTVEGVEKVVGIFFAEEFDAKIVH